MLLWRYERNTGSKEIFKKIIMRNPPRRDDRKEESRNNRDEEKGKEGIKHRGATANGRPSKFTLLKPKKSKTIEIFIRM